MRFLTGGYTADMDGAATGIGVLVAGAPDDVLAGGPLGFAGDAAATDGSPSWVAVHPTLDVAYAALEGAGAVRAFARVGEASFVPLGDPVAAGDLTCHVAVAPDGRTLIASCWGDGRVVRMALDAAGRPSAPVIAEPAVDPYAEPDGFGGAVGLRSLGEPAPTLLSPASPLSPARVQPVDEGTGASHPLVDPLYLRGDGDERDEEQDDARVSRAHQAAFLPGGLVATTDMGFDLVRFWRGRSGGLRAVGTATLPRGSGPRHMRWHPSGHLYVVTELSHEVFVLAPDASGAWRIVGGTSLGPGLAEDDTAAELAASHDGDFLYAGVRGSNTVATLRVRGDGDRLQPVALVEAGVDWPRHHIVVRDTLLVAGQRSNEVASLTLDLRSGVPGRVRHRTPVPSPTCVTALR